MHVCGPFMIEIRHGMDPLPTMLRGGQGQGQSRSLPSQEKELAMGEADRCPILFFRPHRRG